MPPSYRATFTNNPQNVARGRAAVVTFARLCGFSDDAVADIQLAVGEALSNAAEHGRSGQSGGFTLRCYLEDEALHVDVRDSGEGFDLKKLPETSPVERGRGFGIGIMRALMDTIQFSRAGTQVSLVRRLDAPESGSDRIRVERGDA